MWCWCARQIHKLSRVDSGHRSDVFLSKFSLQERSVWNEKTAQQFILPKNRQDYIQHLTQTPGAQVNILHTYLFSLIVCLHTDMALFVIVTHSRIYKQSLFLHI